MNVDCNNFYSIYQFITTYKLIQKSIIISLDLQFTGVKSDIHHKQRYDEFLFERYQKMRHIATKYSIIQVGLCFFIEEGDGIEAYPYNFYVFPRSYRSVNPSVCLQSSAVKFNSSNGMNWNRWIRDGVTYMQLKNIEEAVPVSSKDSFEDLQKRLTPEQIEEIMLIMKRMKEFQQVKNDTLEIEVTSSFVRLVVEKRLDRDYKNMYLQLYNFDSSRKQKLLLTIKKINKESKTEIEKRKQCELFGFTKIFERIWGHKVKVVGHNSFMDLLYIYQSFVTDLPECYFNFKSIINRGLPFYFDTKYLSNLAEFKQKFLTGTSLENIQLTILKNAYFFQPVKITLAEGFQSYELINQTNKAKLHEAGYDAYLTGWIFFHLCRSIDQKKHVSKLPIPWSMYDMNLAGEDDQWNQHTKTTFSLVLTLRNLNRSKHYDDKKNLVYETIDKIKHLPEHTALTKEDVAYKECKFEYLIVQCKNPAKKKQFVEGVKFLETPQVVKVMSFGTWMKMKRYKIEDAIKEKEKMDKRSRK